MEHQNVSALGPMCGRSDPEVVLQASARATTSASTPSPPAARSPGRWSASSAVCSTRRGSLGDGAALLRALDEIGSGVGLARCWPSGSRAAAVRSGRAARPSAAQVKGLELPGYEPRTMQAMALGMAVNAAAPTTTESGAYEADLSGELDRTAGGTRTSSGRSRPRTAAR
jgi:aldehyde:ferredoxin oxidoreductase